LLQTLALKSRPGRPRSGWPPTVLFFAGAQAERGTIEQTARVATTRILNRRAWRAGRAAEHRRKKVQWVTGPATAKRPTTETRYTPRINPPSTAIVVPVM